MAKPYEEPKIDIVLFPDQDIITWSIGGGGGGEDDEDYGLTGIGTLSDDS